MSDSLRNGGAGGLMNGRPTGWMPAAVTALGQILNPSADRLKRIRNWAMLLFLLVAAAMAAVTWRLAEEYFESGVVTIWLVAALLADLALCFAVIVFAAYQTIRKSLRPASASRVQSPLYLQLLRRLSLVALIPAVVMAAVGTSIIVVLGDRIFGEIRVPMDNATNAAESYIISQYERQSQAVFSVSQLLAEKIREAGRLTGGDLRQALQEAHQSVGADVDHLFIVDLSGSVVSRGRDSFTFDCDTVAPEAIEILRGQGGNPGGISLEGAFGVPCKKTLDIGEAEEFWCFEAFSGSAVRGCPDLNGLAGAGWNDASAFAVLFRRPGSDKLYSLTRLAGVEDLFVYGQARINAEILNLHIASQISGSDELISGLAVAVLQWSLAYVAALAALLFLLLRISIQIARRVSRPVEELAELADRVKEDDRDVSIPDFTGADEIAKLGRSFKDMVLRLVKRQDALERQYEEAEAEKRKFDSVLETVSAGVIGLEVGGGVAFHNQAAKGMLEADFKSGGKAVLLEETAPRFYAELSDLLRKCGDGGEAQKKVTFVRSRDTAELLVRAAKWQGRSVGEDFDSGRKGFVISVEDVTELTESERAKFAVNAARQVAHDLKSPLQAAKFGLADIDAKLPDEYRDAVRKHYLAVEKSLERVTDLVNRFKIPGVLGEVRPEPHDVADAFVPFIADVRERYPNVSISMTSGANSGLLAKIDKRNMQDVFENLISNAVDGINDQRKKMQSCGGSGSEPYRGEIRVDIRQAGKMAEISVSDNGSGLPDKKIDFTAANVSTRGPGRGNGLTIAEAAVRKHKGSFTLQDAPKFEGNDHAGAKAVIQLPLCSAENIAGKRGG